jgi:hypothetical protein
LLKRVWERRPRWAGRLLRTVWGQAAGPVVLASATVFSGWWTIAPLAIGAIVTASSIAASRSEADRLVAVNELRNFLVVVLALLESHHAEGNAAFRANVMLVENDTLKIRYAAGAYREEELELSWARGEGVCGRAWQHAQTEVGPTPDHPLPSLEDARSPDHPWGMTTQQIMATTGHVAWVIATPIFSHETGVPVVIGVFSVDDDQAPTQTYEEKIPPLIETIAEAVAERLGRTGLQVPR